MRLPLLAAATLAFALTLHAQTFTPKTIHFDGVPETDAPALLQLTGLTPGKSMSKSEIEAALQKLADTGSYSDINYTVNADALTIKLTVAADHRSMPVRFGNFVWWTPAELERLVEARVPLFHGEMPPEGTLADQVRAALVAIAHDKGLTITVGTTKSKGGTLTLSIDSPPIVTGTITVPEVKPLAGPTFPAFKEGMHDQEFDSEITAGTLVHDTTEIYENAGYLDAAVDPPAFAPPRTQGAGYAIDAALTVHPNDLYRIAAVDVHGGAPLTSSDLQKAANLHPNDPASPMLADLAPTSVTLAYKAHGYLGAIVTGGHHIDKTAHTESFNLTADPGPLYHLARVSVQATVDPQLGTALQHDAHLAAGVPANDQVLGAAYAILTKHNALQTTAVALIPNTTDHTATLLVTPKQAHPHP